MAKFGTAYIEIKPDLSAFGKGLSKEIEARLGNVDVNENIDRNLRPKFAGVGESLAQAISGKFGPELERTVQQAVDVIKESPNRKNVQVDLDIRRAQAEMATVRAELLDLNRQKATPEVKAKTDQAKLALDEIKLRLALLRKEKAEIKVDVDRSKLDSLQNIGSTLGTALHGIAISLGGLLGIGGALTGLGQAAAAALPLVAALAVGVGILVASFGAAVAGAGALGIALAGALGPAAIVAFAALTKVAQIIKAIHDDSKQSASSANAVANAQEQVQSATDGLASAQQNLKTQTASAYQAWQDSIEAVKDDLLAVQDAQLGIEDANLSLREAQLALKEFKAQAPGLQGIFKKFTDVNVNMDGLRKALAEARKAGGNKLSQDDELKLERLILNVRKAKLGEKQATDRLHDSNVQLQRDRQTEVGFLQHGISAYPGYTSAVQGLASAQRSLASAQRAAASAAAAQAGALSKLSPLEQTLAGTFKVIQRTFNKALAPALKGVFTGLNAALRIFVGILSDPKIVRALTGIGRAMGGVLVAFARFLATPKMRAAFVTLANGAARLIRLIGSRVFISFFKILTAIAIAAMPQLVGLFGNLADTLDRWARWIDKHPKEFRARIHDLIGTFKQWLGVLIDIGGFLISLGGTLKGFGDTIGRAFRGGKGVISDFIGSLHLSSQNVQDFSGFIGAMGKAIEAIYKSVLPVFSTALDAVGTAVGGVIEMIAGIIHGSWAESWHGFARIALSGVKAVLTVLSAFLIPFRLLGKHLGDSITSAFRTAFGAVKSVARSIASAVFEIVRTVIRAIDDLNVKIPKKIAGVPVPFVGGHHVGINIPVPDNPFTKKKPNLNTHHLPTLTKAPSNIRAVANGDSAQPQQVIENVDVNISAPASAVPDPRYAARQFALAIRQAGG